ncbi:vegetative cell wall protein gp1 [Capsicum annuum]|uniref:vegetative cell wall protein gp1 n=1 Tax=Capsicum annuum TaxID=4072 RepID=UPI0007BF8D70|nr:vegetative cell wall protein gp1 [Capsicum annuum]
MAGAPLPTKRRCSTGESPAPPSPLSPIHRSDQRLACRQPAMQPAKSAGETPKTTTPSLPPSAPRSAMLHQRTAPPLPPLRRPPHPTGHRWDPPPAVANHQRQTRRDSTAPSSHQPCSRRN